MYIAGDEFEFEVNDVMEYFTCLGEYHYSGIDYLICENEDGVKRAFYYESDDELILVEDEEEEEDIIDSYNEESYKMEEKNFEFWEENEYSGFDGFNDDTLDDIVEDDIKFLEDYDDADEEIDDFLDDLFSDEDEE